MILDEAIRIKPIRVRELAIVVVDRPHVPLDPGGFGNQIAVIVIVLDGSVGLAADDGDGAPAEYFLDEGADVGEAGVVVEVRTAIGTDYAIEFFPRRDEGFGECAHGEDGGDERAAGRVGAGAEEVSGEGGDFLRSEVVFGGFFEEHFCVAVFVARVLVGFGGEGIEEVVAAVGFAAAAETVFPGGVFCGDFGEYWEGF